LDVAQSRYASRKSIIGCPMLLSASSVCSASRSAANVKYPYLQYPRSRFRNVSGGEGSRCMKNESLLKADVASLTRTIADLFGHLRAMGVDTAALWRRIDEVVALTVIAAHRVLAEGHAPACPSCGRPFTDLEDSSRIWKMFKAHSETPLKVELLILKLILKELCQVKPAVVSV